LGAEAPDLGVLAMRDDLGLDPGPVDERSADLDRIAFADEQDLEGDLGPDVPFELLDLEEVAFLDAVLLAAGADDCVHRSSLASRRAGLPSAAIRPAGRRIRP